MTELAIYYNVTAQLTEHATLRNESRRGCSPVWLWPSRFALPQVSRIPPRSIQEEAQKLLQPNLSQVESLLRSLESRIERLEAAGQATPAPVAEEKQAVLAKDIPDAFEDKFKFCLAEQQPQKLEAVDTLDDLRQLLDQRLDAVRKELDMRDLLLRCAEELAGIGKLVGKSEARLNNLESKFSMQDTTDVRCVSPSKNVLDLPCTVLPVTVWVTPTKMGTMEPLQPTKMPTFSNRCSCHLHAGSSEFEKTTESQMGHRRRVRFAEEPPTNDSSRSTSPGTDN